MPTSMRFFIATSFLTALLCCAATGAPAQSLTGQISQLLTEQQPTSAFTPDPAAATATLDTLAGLFAVELGSLPVDSSSGGFVYRLNPSLGTVGRASSGFGPFMTESVLRGGRRQVGFGLRYQFANFKSLQGDDLTDGTFPANASRAVGSTAPFSVDLLSLELEARSVSLVGNYGVTERLSLGGSLPITTIRFRGQRARVLNSLSSLQSIQSGSSTGIGDIGVNARYRVIDQGARGVSLGADLRLPTGSEEDLRGVGDLGARLLGIGTWEDGALALHANGGVGVGGVSRELFWSTAAAYAATPRVTLVGEMLGRHLSELSRLLDVYEPHVTLAGVETMRWISAERGIHTMFLVTGAKWNIARSWLVNGNVIIRLSDHGLRARVTPTLSLEFDFQQ